VRLTLRAAAVIGWFTSWVIEAVNCHRRDAVAVQLQLRFGQMGFTAAQPVFGLLGFIESTTGRPLDNSSLPSREARHEHDQRNSPSARGDGAQPGR